MRDALYQVVLAILQGEKMPADWEGALVKLLPKKPGEEAILESTKTYLPDHHSGKDSHVHLGTPPWSGKRDSRGDGGSAGGLSQRSLY